jgi:uncharacterized protein with PQ loop repeat
MQKSIMEGRRGRRTMIAANRPITLYPRRWSAIEDQADGAKEDDVLATEWNVGDVALSMLWISVLALWIFLVLRIFGDIMRSGDLSGLAKATWTVAVIAFPYAGVLIYLVVHGDNIGSRMATWTIPDASADSELDSGEH